MVHGQHPKKGTSQMEETTSSLLSARLEQVTTGHISSSPEQEHNKDKESGPHIGVDLNTGDDLSEVEHNSFCPYKKLGQLKPADASECSSTTGPLEESESLRIWKKMKQNGFLSLSHGGIPAPKQQGRQPKKRKKEVHSVKAEVPKKEQLSRFAKLAAPSGLLAGLDPGIIKHVRNSKQVHSIIEAIVRSQKHDGQTTPEMPLVHHESCSSQLASEYNNDTLAVKLSSDVTLGSVNASRAFGDDFSASQGSVTSLSLKAATVASQWLELLQLDIKGRLAVLRRSKKRVRNVVQTELPYLLSSELSSNLENGPCSGGSSGAGCSPSDMHVARWRSVFSQMDKALYEEGNHIESWLRQVKDMQLYCETGLRYVGSDALSQTGPSENSRSEKPDEMESAVKAAAAAIYSTCNFVAKEKTRCF